MYSVQGESSVILLWNKLLKKKSRPITCLKSLDVLTAKLEVKNMTEVSNVSVKWQLRKNGSEDISVIVWEWFVSVRAWNMWISKPFAQVYAKEGAGR